MDRINRQLGVPTDIAKFTGGQRHNSWRLDLGRGQARICLKVQRTQSPVASLAIEARCLKALESTGLVPRLALAGDDYLVTEHVDGSSAAFADIGILLPALARLRAAAADVPSHDYGPASVFSARSDIAACLRVARDRSASTMPEELKELVAVVLSRCRDRGTRDPVVVHGSFDRDNVIIADRGPVFLDLEACRHGQREFDLGALLLGALSDPELLHNADRAVAAIGAISRAGDEQLTVAHAVVRLVFRFQNGLPVDDTVPRLLRTISDGP